ncbi:site-2 protease family protein [Priestia filamentosa]|uniref:site-2 protease family protein n=1 Tax=Priestia filamentosa TaxID=1402861 RepID=UPI00397C0AEA
MQVRTRLKAPKLKMPTFKLPVGKIGSLIAGLIVIAKLAQLPTIISLGVMLWFYMHRYGWQLGIITLFYLVAHEYGHLYAARKLGVRTSNAIFIPFVGALIALKERPQTVKDEAFIAYMGPLVGSLAVFVTAVPLYFITHHELWLVAMAIGFTLNLFNLIPVTPMDGGRIVAAISPKLWILGFIMIVVFAVLLKTFVLCFVVFMSALELFLLRKIKKSNEKLADILSERKETLQEFLEEAIKNKKRRKADELESKDKAKDNPFEHDLYMLRKKLSEHAEEEVEGWKWEITLAVKQYDEVQQRMAYYKIDKGSRVKITLIYVSMLLVLSSWFLFSLTMLS